MKQKRKIKSSKFKKKNPTDLIRRKAEEYVDENVQFLGEGDYSEVYLFYKNNVPFLIKIPVISYTNRKQDEFTPQQISHLKELSKAKLIPKIYEINPQFLIMDYIPAKSLNLAKLQLSGQEIEIVFENLKKEILRWHKKGFSHGDIHLDNILVDKNLKVYLIDPGYNNFYGYASDLDAVNYYKINLFKVI